MMKKIMTSIAILFTVLTCNAQMLSEWKAGPNFVLPALEDLYLGTNFIGTLGYEFNKTPNNEISCEFAVRLGYFDYQNKEGNTFRSNLLGLEINVTDDEFGNKLGFFVDRAWSFNEYIAGMQMSTMLYEGFIFEGLDLRLILIGGYDRGNKNLYVSPQFGISGQLEKTKEKQTLKY